MGKTPSKQIYNERAVRVLIFDIHDDGITSVLYEVKLEDVDSIILCTGLDEVQLYNKDSKVKAWDVGTRCNTRQAMRIHYDLTDAVVCVVDSIYARMDETKEQIDEIIKVGCKKAPILVMANNRDEPNASSKEVIIEELGLTKITDRKWNIVFCSAENSNALQEGPKWLAGVLIGKIVKKDIHESLMTSVKDITQEVQMQEERYKYGIDRLKASLQWILSGCKV